MKLKEESLYPIVERFLRDTTEGMGCFEVGQRKGTTELGIADVIGVRHVGRDRSNSFELVTVEVKRNAKSYGKKIGEALGYSLLAHRCYLAARDRFDPLQKQFAAQLGVGLIEIKAGHCREALAASSHQPNEHQMLSLLKGMGLRRCCICGALTKSRYGRSTPNASTAIRKGIPYVLHSTSIRQGRLVLCPECVKRVQEMGLSEQDVIDKLRALTGSSRIWNLFLSLRKHIKGFGSNVEERPTKWRLSFAIKRPFFHIYPKRDFISVIVPGERRRHRVHGKSDLKRAERLAKMAYKRANHS